MFFRISHSEFLSAERVTLLAIRHAQRVVNDKQIG